MKRWIAALLSAVLLLSVSGAALAADPDTVEISSAEDLAELSALCTSDAWSEGKTIVLTRDISLTGCDFSSIPLLAGTFDGRGHSILGISLDGDASTQGLFRMVLKTGVVKNLTVSGTLRATGNGENIGGIAGVNYGAIENCRFDGDILAQAAAGGIVAEPLDAGHIAAILREEKLIPVAQLAAFKDPISPRTDPSMAIHYNGSALWLDAQKNGNPWLNPYSTAAVEYVGDLVEEVQQLGFEQVVLTNVQFPKLSKKQDYGTTNGVSRADQLKADIAALQDRFSGKVTLWFSYTLDQCKNSSVALDVPALTLGVQNLLVTSDAAMDADALQALETAATDAGVENLTVHAADRFETDRVSG